MSAIAVLLIAMLAFATVALRNRLRATREYADVPLSPLAFVAKAVCLALRRTPELNAKWDEPAGEIVFHHRVGLGIAADTPHTPSSWVQRSSIA